MLFTSLESIDSCALTLSVRLLLVLGVVGLSRMDAKRSRMHEGETCVDDESVVALFAMDECVDGAVLSDSLIPPLSTTRAGGAWTGGAIALFVKLRLVLGASAVSLFIGA